MAFNLNQIGAEIQKNKKILIPAAIGGGVLGLYVLSKKGGLGGGNGAPPPGTDAGQQPGTGTSGSGTDWGSAIQQLQDALTQSTSQNQDAIAALVEGNQSYQSQISRAFEDITRQVNDALSANSTSVNDQINSALAGVRNQPLYDPMAGLESLFAQSPVYNPQNFIRQAAQPLTQTVKPQAVGKTSSNLITQLKRVTSVPKVNPNTYAQQLASTFGRATQTLKRTPTPNIQRLPNLASGFNQRSSGGSNRGVPINLGSRYVPYVQGKLKVPAKPASSNIRRISSLGGLRFGK